MAADIQAVEQAACTDCGKSEENYTVEDRLLSEKGVYRHLVCACGAEGIVRISSEGLHVGGPISHEDASWNEGDD